MKLRMKRSMGLCISVVILSLLWVVPTFANTTKERLFPEYTGSKAQVISDKVNLRSYPSEYSDVLETINKEDIYILGANQSWYRVKVHDREGWIARELIDTNEESFIPYSKVLGEEVVEYGKQFIGTPYVWGGNDLRKGVDCSGLTQRIFAGFDINISRISYMQADDGRSVEKCELRPGDLVFFDTSGVNRGNISHVGIYAGDGMFLHADCTKGVTLSSLSNSYYMRNYVTSSRILEDI